MMTNIDSLAFLNIGDETLTLNQSLGYLQAFGRLRPLIQEIVTQHVLLKEIQSRDDLNVTSSDFEQAVIEFRIQKKLTDADTFQNWLSQEGMDYAAFQNRILLGFKLDKLRIQIASPKLEEYFLKKKNLLEKIELNCLVFNEKEMAASKKEQILAQSLNLEQIIKNPEIRENPQIKVISGVSRRQDLAPPIRQAAELAKVGELMGELEISGKWFLFEIEKVIPSVLDNKVQKEIENQILEEWLAEKTQGLSVNFAFNL